MTREELDRAHEAVTVKHRRMLEDNFKAHLPLFLDALAAIAIEYAEDLDDEHRGEHVPQSVPPLTAMPPTALESQQMAQAAPTAGSGRGAPASKPPMTSLPPGRTTTPRRPAARRKAT